MPHTGTGGPFETKTTRGRKHPWSVSPRILRSGVGAHWHQLRFHPNNFPQRLKRFQEETGLSWSEPARHLETNRHTVWRWAEGRVRPNCQHRKALVELCDSLGLGLMGYTIPMPDDSPIPGRNAEGMALNGSALAFVRNGGPYGK